VSAYITHDTLKIVHPSSSPQYKF